MKKAITFILAFSLCVVFAACSKDKAEENTNTTEPQSVSATEAATEPIVEKTTAEPKSDSQKGNELKDIVISTLGSKEDAEISGDLKYGKFVYQYNREAGIVYANERNDETEKLATEHAKKLADSISGLYGDELKLHSSQAKQIGTGENGIDSVQYQFYYINSQNQLLTIYADSDGEISYADCKFTW